MLDEDLYENYETRHSTEPSKAIIKIHFQEKVCFLPKNKLKKNLLNDLNKSYNPNSNFLNSTIPNMHYLISESALYSDRNKKNKRKTNLNITSTIDRMRDKGLSFISMYNSNRKDGKANKNHTNETNTSIVLDSTSRKTLNETFVLKSNRSFDNIIKKKVNLFSKIRRGIKRMMK